MTAIDFPDLDLSSTSPNLGLVVSPSFEPKTDDLPLPKCTYANVWFAYQIGEKNYGVCQGCCNHWDCPRCGKVRAKQEYHRLVMGVHELSQSGYSMWFQTVTCRGKEMSKQEADSSYLAWTNRLLDSYRARVKTQGGHWAYVQVTERQKRGYPHSHFITTFEPGDLVEGCVEKWENIGGDLKPYWKDALRSEWLQMAVCRSGLGDQYDISMVRTEAAASRYVAKYLFKESAFSSDWPKGWRRVRYSQSFPKLPEIKTDAFVLRDYRDWEKLARIAVRVVAQDEDVFEYAQWKLYGNDVIVTRRKSKSVDKDN